MTSKKDITKKLVDLFFIPGGAMYQYIKDKEKFKSKQDQGSRMNYIMLSLFESGKTLTYMYGIVKAYEYVEKLIN